MTSFRDILSSRADDDPPQGMDGQARDDLQAMKDAFYTAVTPRSADRYPPPTGITTLLQCQSQRHRAARSCGGFLVGVLLRTRPRPKTVTFELASPVCFHATGSGLPPLSRPSNEKTNVITCGVDGSGQSRHRNLARDAALMAAPLRTGAPPRSVVLATLPLGRTSTRTLTFPLTLVDSAFSG